MKILLVLVVVIIATGCGGPSSDGDRGGPTSPAGSGSVGPYDGAWELVSGRGPGGEIPIVEGSSITLTIAGASIGGTAACNGYGADGAISGSSISAVNVAVTEMACEPRVMESEQAYLAALGQAETIERNKDLLVVRGPDVELRFVKQPPPPTAKLVGTNWKLESLLRGRGVDGTATSVSGGSLQLFEDGSLTGSTGCRDLTGQWRAHGDEIVVPSLAAEGQCPPEFRDQDAHVIEVLESGFTAEVDGSSLTIFSGEAGLQYRGP